MPFNVIEHKHENPLPGQVLINVENFSSSGQDDGYGHESREVVAELDKANAVTSRTLGSLLKADGTHKPVLDVDFPVKAVESSTPGHFHLYIDKAMTWADYARLLNVLAEVGLLEQGYVDAAIRRRYTTVRLPWVRKESDLGRLEAL